MCIFKLNNKTNKQKYIIMKKFITSLKEKFLQTFNLCHLIIIGDGIYGAEESIYLPVKKLHRLQIRDGMKLIHFEGPYPTLMFGVVSCTCENILNLQLLDKRRSGEKIHCTCCKKEHTVSEDMFPK